MSDKAEQNSGSTTRTLSESLQRLIRSGHHCISIVTNEEPFAVDIAKDAAIALGQDAFVWSAVTGVRHALLADEKGIAGTENPAAAMFRMSQFERAGIFITLDMSAHLDEPSALRALRELLYGIEMRGGTLVMIDYSERIHPAIAPLVTRFECPLPGAEELEHIVKDQLRRIHRQTPIKVTIGEKDIRTIVRNLRGLTRTQAEIVVRDIVVHDQSLDPGDIQRVVDLKRTMLFGAGLLEFVDTPNSVDEIGGLARIKRWLDERALSFSDDAAEFGLTPPKGVLLLGVQGAGKSLCAKSVAASWRLPLLRLDPGVLYDRYVGESERRLRDALHQTEMMAPVVLWIDEIEKAFASAASRSTDGGLSQRMFGTLLTWLQDRAAPVFVVATANDIEALPPELLRKGRFDEIFFVDLPGAAARREIFSIHLRRRKRKPDEFDLDRLAEESRGMSGAEIEQAIIAALHTAFASRKDLNTEQIVEAIDATVPLSVTMSERICALREWAEQRCVPAEDADERE